jgi:DNA-binding IclR family transcriptional regulator
MEATGESVQLAVLDHMSVLYINKMESSKAVRMSSSVGSRAPAHCTSAGKALLAYQPPEVVNQLIAGGLKAYTASSITSAEGLRAELAAVRSRGYAIDDEESEVGLRGVAAPIRNHSGVVVAAIGMAAPVQRMSKKLMQGCVPSVTGAAETISRRLGYQPPGGARKQAE